MRRNLAIIYATSALMWGRFFLPVLALFYVASNVSLGEFGIIMGVFALVTLLLEVPSGIVADFLGKKQALLIARSCYVIEIIILCFADSFWPFLIAKVISGVGISLSSGTDSALLYDTLRRSYKEHRHKEVKGKVVAITYISMAFVFIIGAYLFTIHPKLPAVASLPLVTLGLVLTMFLKEPYKPNKHVALSNVGRHLSESISYFRRHVYVRYLVFYGMPLAAAINIILAYSSAYYEHIKIPIWAIGAIAFIVAFTTAFAAKNAKSIEKQVGEKDSLRYLPVFLVIGILLLSLSLPYVGIVFYLFVALASGFLSVVLDNYLNRHIETTNRATMLSINNLFASLAIFILFPITGGLIGLFSIGVGYALLAGILSLYMIGFFFIFERKPY